MTTNPRKIKFIVVHCTATQPTATVEAIRRYWKEQRGWGDTPGYHYLLLRDGEFVQLLAEEKASYGVYGHNAESINLSYIGGIDKDGKPQDTRTDEQKEAMFNKIVELTERYPEAEVLGHRDFPGVAKACPSFDVKSWLKGYEPNLKKAA
jgi:N-acetylmuramoyl-L-alanine amidase